MNPSKRMRIIQFVRQYWRTNGYGPTRREIAAAVGVTEDGMSQHLTTLKHMGMVKSTGGWRGLSVVEGKRA